MQPDSTGNCPVCERYIGPVSKCPYCNAKNSQSPIMRTIRIIAILLATVGLFLIYVTAKHRQPPLVAIENITPSMNFAHVHIAGVVKRKPYISQDQDYISFRIYGNNSSLKVVAYRKVAENLINKNLLPSAGDRVDVRGNLNVSAQSKIKLYLKIPDHLTIITDNPKSDS